MIVVVADASPLIALERIGRLELLKALFEEVLIPPAVAAEVAPRLRLPPWICERALQHPIAREVLPATLGPGESEAISLALEIHADRLIIDERPVVVSRKPWACGSRVCWGCLSCRSSAASSRLCDRRSSRSSV